MSCNGDSSAYIALHMTGGNGFYSYSWNTGSTSDSIYNLTNGTYSVTIFDGYGCRKDTAVTLTEPTIVIPTVTPSVFNGGANISCNGYMDGRARANVSGGVAPYTYMWSNGDVADSALGLTAGAHWLAVTDSNGCTSIIPFSMVQPTPVDINPTFSTFNGYNVACYGDSGACVNINATGGSGPYQFVWGINDTLTSAILCNLPADTYSVRVIDANFCQVDTTFTLTTPEPLADSTIVTTYNGGYEVQCNGMTNGNIDVTAIGGVAPFTYEWSTTDTTEDLTNLGAGTYQVIITDNNACKDTISFTLTEPPSITETVSMIGTTCSQNNGTAQVSVSGGLTPFTYSWSPSGQTTATANNLPPGWHTIVVTDSVGCTRMDSINVIAIPVIGLGFTSQVDNICPGYANGSIQGTTSGGTAPFTYLWSNGDNTSVASNLPAGFVTLQITDASGCIESDSIEIFEPQWFSTSYNVTNAYCAGINNGVAQIMLSGGNGPYQFTWSNGDIGAQADSLGGGYAVVNYTDANGCFGTDSVNIIQLNALVSAIASTGSVSCNGNNDGVATVMPVSGGAPPYSYSWSNGDVGMTADSLPGGTATLTITDVNNCFTTVVAPIFEPAPLTVTSTTQAISCDGNGDGHAIAHVTGGTTGYIYTWSPYLSSDSVANNLHEGVYSITVTDANNCSATATAIVTIGDCDLDLPTAFSPNGDGNNDFYVIHGLHRYPNNILKVFNRWGNEVYTKENYTNDDWFGQSKEGLDLPDGTYFLLFQVTDHNIRKNTYVDLRRGR
jgi:gliding motility-associated-like protein